MDPQIRAARPEELEVLLEMQQRSFRVLGAAFYPRDLVEAALAQMGTMDPRMIGDGTYLVAELDGRIIGSAGWTMRRPNYARLLCEALPPVPGRVGTVRSVYADPDFARGGIARRLMAEVEAQLVRGDAATAELLATLCGVPFYAALGYVPLSNHALQLAAGMELPVQRMARALPAAQAVA